MKRILMISVFLFFCSLLNAKDLYPLHKNAYWKYSVVDSNGTFKKEYKIISAKSINNKKWYKLLDNDGIVFWIRNAKGGQFEIKDDQYKDDNFLNKNPKELLTFKFPAKEGNSWTYYNGKVTYDGLKKIKVPIGEFNCHMYTFSFPDDFYQKSCITEGIGIIYNEVIFHNDEKEISKLVNYKLK